jgi:aryl carrier-like protein
MSSESNIYQLGIDSVSVLSLATHLRRTKGLSLTAADILEKPRLADLETLIRAAMSNHQSSPPHFDFTRFQATHERAVCEELGVGSDAIEAIIPSTPLQQGMLAQSTHNRGRYINAMAYKVADDYSVSALQTAWTQMVSRHPILRSGFVQVDDLMFPFAMVILTTINMTNHLKESKQVPNLQYTRTKFIRSREDSHRLPPWEVTFSQSQDGTFMTIIMHHALYDAHSLRLMLSDLNVALQSLPIISPATALNGTINNIIAHAVPESLGRTVSVCDPSATFWKEALKEASITRFPCLTPLRQNTKRTDLVTETSSMSLTDLKVACQRAGITLQAAGQAAWALLLSAYAGDDHVTFGTVLSGRDIHQVSRNLSNTHNTVGGCSKSLPTAF